MANGISLNDEYCSASLTEPNLVAEQSPLLLLQSFTPFLVVHPSPGHLPLAWACAAASKKADASKKIVRLQLA